MNNLANYISITRIILVLFLAFLEPLSFHFYLIYTVSGISDIMDGYIARKTKSSSKLGEKLDSAADFIMVVVLIPIFYTILNPGIVILLWIIVIGIIRVISLLIVLIKYKTFGMLHTYGNKITGLILFLIPLLLIVVPKSILMYLVCSIASVSALEELGINLLSKELSANKKSIFSK
jgi:CDP-diacylglycerol--glycerol-3-phosphate 3-phosphatidyltransferase